MNIMKDKSCKITLYYTHTKDLLIFNIIKTNFNIKDDLSHYSLILFNNILWNEIFRF